MCYPVYTIYHTRDGIESIMAEREREATRKQYRNYVHESWAASFRNLGSSAAGDGRLFGTHTHIHTHDEQLRAAFLLRSIYIAVYRIEAELLRFRGGERERLYCL